MGGTTSGEELKGRGDYHSKTKVKRQVDGSKKGKLNKGNEQCW